MKYQFAPKSRHEGLACCQLKIGFPKEYLKLEIGQESLKLKALLVTYRRLDFQRKRQNDYKLGLSKFCSRKIIFSPLQENQSNKNLARFLKKTEPFLLFVSFDGGLAIIIERVGDY